MWKRRDIIFIGCLFVVGLLLTAFILLPQKSYGSVVQVKVDGQIVYQTHLSKDTTKRIQTPYGYNTLVIKNKSVSISESDCKNKICVHEHSISRIGESIVCLPHHLSITISGKANDVDAVAS